MNRDPQIPPPPSGRRATPRAAFLRVDLAVDQELVDALFTEAPSAGLLPGPRVVPTIDADGREHQDLAGITRARLSVTPAYALSRAVVALQGAVLLSGEAQRHATRRAIALALAALALER